MWLNWKDRGHVRILSSIVDICKDENNRPNLVNEYRNHMHGVDISNQLSETFRWNVRVNKWWKAIF